MSNASVFTCAYLHLCRQSIRAFFRFLFFDDFDDAARAQSFCAESYKLFRVFHRRDAACRFHLHSFPDVLREQFDVGKRCACL